MISDVRRRQRASAIVASSLITAAGGALDAWVYLSHGHVFANAQTGNIVLMTVSLVHADFVAAHLPRRSGVYCAAREAA